MSEIRKNDEYRCRIEGYTSEGFGVARVDGRAVFVPFAKKGEEYTVHIVKVSNTAVYGKIDALPVTDCPYFGKCGGCHLRHLSYEEELAFKLDKVNEALRRIGHQSVFATEIIPAENTERYRNKAVFDVADGRFGFYRPRSHDLIEIKDCLLQSEFALRVAKEIDKFGLNHIYIRDSVCTLAGPSYAGPVPDGLTGLVLCDNRRENSVLDGEFTTLFGKAEQVEKLCGFDFVISPQAFYQVNPMQAEKLYRKAVEYAGKGKHSLELYCGAGTISLCLARNFEKVTATEIVPEAVENARNNARLNGIDNVSFICADASSVEADADVLVVDPPRKGMSNETIASVLRIAPKRIVYVSCNPSTLARDIALLQGYELQKVTAVDMFPRTHHVECVALLSRVAK